MHVGLSTACFYPDYPIEDTIRLLKEMNVEVTEVFLGSYSEYNTEFCQKLKMNMDRYDIDVHSVHTLSTQFEPQIFARTYRQRKDALAIWEEVLAGAQLMGAKAYVFHGPPVILNTKPKLDFNRIGKIVDEMASIAASYEIKFTWENVYWCWFAAPEFAIRLLENTRSDNIYFTLDIKQAVKSGYRPEEFISTMGDRIANVHVCDFDGRGNLYLPGKGRYNFKSLHRALLEHNYSGPIMLEVYRENYKHYSDMEDAIEYLEDIFSSRSIQS